MKINHMPVYGNISNSTDSEDISLKLKSGDIIRGKIVDVKPDEVTLRLYNGAKVTLETSEPIEARQGQVVELMVNIKEGNKVVLSHLSDALANQKNDLNSNSNSGNIIDFMNENTKSENYISTKLETLSQNISELANKEQNGQQQVSNTSSISVQNNNQTTKEINIIDVKNQLISNHTYPSNDLINKVIEVINKFDNIDLKSAAFAVSNDIQNDNRLMQRLIELVGGRADVAEDIEALIQSFTEIEDEAVLKSIYTALKDNENTTSSNNNINTVNNENITNNNINTLNSANNIENINIIKPESDISIINIASQVSPKEAIEDGGFSEHKTELLVNPNLLSQNEKETINSKFSTVSLNDNNIQSSIEESEEMTLKQYKDSEGNINQSVRNMVSDVRQGLKSMKVELDIGLKEILLNGEKDINITSEEKLERIKELFQKDIPIISKDIEADSINLKRIYNGLLDKLENVKSIIEESSLSNKQQILNTIDRIDTSVRFSNEINTYSAYAQIPFTIGDKSKSGELYILRKKGKGKKINREDTTVFITLDTMNMGRVDTLINVKYKNVSVNVGVMKEEFYDYIKDNHKALYEGLQEKGYKLVSLNHKLITKNINVANAMESHHESVQKGSSIIDYKL